MDTPKTRDEVALDHPECDTFTIPEFLELVRMGALEDVDSYGYYHDGQELTEVPVRLDEQEIKELGRKYPYIVWRDISC